MKINADFSKHIVIRPEDYDRFHTWSDDMIAGEGNFDHPEIMQKAGQAFMEYTQYISKIIDERRESPRDDLSKIIVPFDQ